jgi:anti-anti-sigma factor
MTARIAHSLLDVDRQGNLTVATVTTRAVADEEAVHTLGEQLSRLASEVGHQRLMLNLGNVESLATKALGQLITCHKRIRAAGGRLMLCNLNPTIHEILRTTRMDRLFDIWEDASLPMSLEGDAATAERAADGEPGRTGLARARVALCDPRPDYADLLAIALAQDLPIAHYSTLDELERNCQRDLPAAIALPLRWPVESADQDDAGVLRFIREYGRHVAVVVYADTNRLSIESYSRALAAGARQVVHEETHTFVEDLRQTLARLVSDHFAHLEEQESLTTLFAQHGLLGESMALREVFRRAVKASHLSDLPILITGETGTGKQRLAEAIHALDQRRGRRPFVTVNCSAISKTLAESELFGHSRGAFSGAAGDRLGLFRAANGGTILLDEVGELDLELQPKLLRVLQERRLLPLGEDFEHPIDVRIIAATNRPLEDMIAQGRFRSDLYQRLNVFQVRIPPLRERPDDIECQARHFLLDHQRSGERTVIDLSPRVLDALRLLPWEGNTRQLENLIRETLAHKQRGQLLQMEDLPRWVLERIASTAHAPIPNNHRDEPDADSLTLLARQACDQGLTLSDAVDEFERRLILEMLRRTGGNRTRTANLLGLNPRSIFNKIKKHKLD